MLNNLKVRDLMPLECQLKQNSATFRSRITTKKPKASLINIRSTQKTIHD